MAITWLNVFRSAACALILSTAAACTEQVVTPGPSGASVGPEAPTEVLTIDTASGPVTFNVEIADDENERVPGCRRWKQSGHLG